TPLAERDGDGRRGGSLMRYLALGDSISIDDYTGVPKGGAVNQFARLIGAAEVEDWTRDGGMIGDVLVALDRVTIRPDIVTLTVGGNDFLYAAWLVSSSGDEATETARLDAMAREITAAIGRIASRLAAFRCPVILNTIYDPTDGDDSLSGALNIPPS